MFRQQVVLADKVADSHARFEGVVARAQHVAVESCISPQGIVDGEDSYQVKVLDPDRACQFIDGFAGTVRVEAEVIDQPLFMGCDA